jgi:HD-GYP domain-containing protein (c-di-GMP phosphodiesterase class II)
MAQYLVKDIPPNSFFSKPALLDGQFVLAAPEMPFTPKLQKSLQDWEFREIQSEGEPQVEYCPLGADRPTEDEMMADPTLQSDGDQIRAAEEFYAGFHNYVKILFTQIAVKGELEFKPVAEKIKELCDFLREDRRYLLRVLRTTESGDSHNYLASHAVKSTIISIIIGFYLKLPTHRLIELGVAALLHEIGMMKLPPQIYLNKRALTPQERKAILTHPVHSYNMLKNFGFPLTISLAALEHHERESGDGYPQKLTGDKISLYAKIIAVTCSYEALTSARPHKDAKDGYTGMLDLLKNIKKQYDDTVVRALVYSLSIYPIGLYVLLSNGKKGQVVDVNPENPRFPIVQILGEITPDGKTKTLETSAEGLSIVRPLLREEITPS